MSSDPSATPNPALRSGPTSLSASLPLFHDEHTQISWLSRLAAINDCISIKLFCSDLNLSLVKLRAGDPQSLERIAELAGADISMVKHNAIIKESQRSYRLRGCHIHQGMVRGDRYACCPECIREDLEAGSRREPWQTVHLRLSWALKAVRTCVQHGVALHFLETGHLKYDHRDFVTALCEEADRGDLSAWAKVRHLPTEFENYVVDRLSGKEAGIWLDQMELSAAVRSCEIIGTVARYGGQLAIRDLEEADRSNCAQTGFEILVGGEASLHAFFSAHLEKKFRTEGKRGRKGILTRFIYESYSNSNKVVDLSLLEKEFSKFCSDETIQIGYRKKPKVKVETSCAPSSVEWLPAAILNPIPQEMITAECYLSSLSDRSSPITDGAHRPISTSVAAARLGIPVKEVKRLRDAGFLLSARECWKGTQSTKLCWRSVYIFLGKIMSQVSSGENNTKLAPLTEIKLRKHCTLIQALSLLFEGKLRNVSYSEAGVGLGKILVSPDEIGGALYGVSKADLMTTREACRFLTTSYEVVSELSNQDFLQTVQIASGGNAKVRTLLTRKSVHEFCQKFVSLQDLARERGTGMKGLEKKLALEGIRPAIPHDRCGATFFSRSTI